MTFLGATIHDSSSTRSIRTTRSRWRRSALSTVGSALLARTHQATNCCPTLPTRPIFEPGHTPRPPTSARSDAPQMQGPTPRLHTFLHHFSLHFLLHFLLHFRHDLHAQTHRSAVPTDLDPPPFAPHEAPDQITRCRPSQSVGTSAIPLFSFSLSEHPDVSRRKPTAGESWGFFLRYRFLCPVGPAIRIRPASELASSSPSPSSHQASRTLPPILRPHAPCQRNSRPRSTQPGEARGSRISRLYSPPRFPFPVDPDPRDRPACGVDLPSMNPAPSIPVRSCPSCRSPGTRRRRQRMTWRFTGDIDSSARSTLPSKLAPPAGISAFARPFWKGPHPSRSGESAGQHSILPGRRLEQRSCRV